MLQEIMVCRESQFLVGFYTVSLNQCKSIQIWMPLLLGKKVNPMKIDSKNEWIPWNIQ
jgi:hypothetical protein